MLIIKKRNIQKGFSLIELMIAAIILAIALLGIFQAYSVGFMGMADARDRTVATNYLREMIEDFKNMDFKKVKDEPITLIPGTKFHRGAIVLDLEEKGGAVDLKKVITQVRWMDRKGNIKTEEASTILYSTPSTSEISDALGIVIYAQPYYAILPEHEVELTAEIKDKNGNTISDWEGDITFSIIIPDDPNYNPVGYINNASRTKENPEDTKTVHTTNGTTSIIFTAFSGESLEGIEKIQASAILEEVVTDTVNIRVTTGAVAIILAPATEDDEILPTDEISTINVTVVKADYATLIEYSGDITLSAKGPGTLSNTTINSVSADPANPTTVTLTSNGTPGIVEVTASAPDLDMGYTEITFTGAPKSILVSSDKKSIYPDEETTITVTIVDENNKPVSFGEAGTPKTVVITDIPDDYGTLNGSTGFINLTFEGENSQTCIFKASSTGEFPQEITISANDSGGELNSGSTKINILSPLVAHHIDVTFDPSIIELDEDPIIPSEITAIMKSEDGYIVYGNFIIFEITNGEGSFSSDVSTTDTTLTGGMATATLYPYNVESTTTAYIKIYSNDLTTNPDGPPGNPDNPIIIEVLFHKKSDPHHINLAANPTEIFIGGQTSTITATIVDESGVIVPDYSGVVEFSILDGTSLGKFSDGTTIKQVDVVNGIAEVILKSTNNAGIVTVEAKDDTPELPIIQSLTIDIPVKDITLILVNGSVYYWSGFKIITFNIEINAPDLNLINMTISWNKDDSFLNEIGIKTPSTNVSYDHVIDTGNASTDYTTDNIDQILSSGESTIRLTFSKNIKNVPITVTFSTAFGEYFEKDYIVEF